MKLEPLASHIFYLVEYHGMSDEPLEKISGGILMCGNNNGLCGCIGNNWWLIIILVLLFCYCGNGTNTAGICGCDRC